MGEQVAAGFPNGGLAQLGEHLPCKQGVESSNLLVSTLAMSNARHYRQARRELARRRAWMECRIVRST